MGGTSTDDLTVTVAQRLLERLDVLVTRLGEAYREEVPEYAALGEAQMLNDVLPVSREIVGGFFEALVEGGQPDVGRISLLRTMGRRRLEMGVPLEPMLHVYRVASRVVWNAIVEVTEPGESAVLATMGGWWMDYMDRASSVAASGYLEASHERLRRLDARRGALLEALLGAVDESDVAAVAAEHSLALTDSYAPVLATGGPVAGRIDRAAAVLPSGTISGHRGAAVVFLVPGDAPPLTALATEIGARVVVHGRSQPPGPLLAAEVRHAERMLHATERFGRDGTFGPDDLVVEQLLLAEPRAADTLRRRVVEPLHAADRDGMVLATLRAYLETGSVPATATRVSVHPNTVSYRLRRVAELTGLDARVPADAVLLTLALTGLDEERARPGL